MNDGQYQSVLSNVAKAVDMALTPPKRFDPTLLEPCMLSVQGPDVSDVRDAPPDYRPPDKTFVVHAPFKVVEELLRDLLDAAGLRRCERCEQWYPPEMMRWRWSVCACTTCARRDEEDTPEDW